MRSSALSIGREAPQSKTNPHQPHPTTLLTHISEAVRGVQVQLVGVVLLKNPTGAENKGIGTIAVEKSTNNSETRVSDTGKKRSDSVSATERARPWARAAGHVRHCHPYGMTGYWVRSLYVRPESVLSSDR